VRFVLGIAAFAVVLAWQLRGVMHADLPVLRAIQALGGTSPCSWWPSPPSTCPSPKPRPPTSASRSTTPAPLYLAITVFSTVGFDDITPEDDLARIVISIQMLLDLVVIGAVVRLLTTAAKRATVALLIRRTTMTARPSQIDAP
jgi:voltage-gated potassium channel